MSFNNCFGGWDNRKTGSACYASGSRSNFVSTPRSNVSTPRSNEPILVSTPRLRGAVNQTTEAQAPVNRTAEKSDSERTRGFIFP